MTYSKIHEKFSEYLNVPDALTNPGKYLGPNWEHVLNFWIYIDTLSDPEKKEMGDRYRALDEDVRDSAWDAVWYAAGDVVGGEFREKAYCAVGYVTGWSGFGVVTCELIGSHKILDQNKPLTFLPLCTKP